MGPDGGIGTPHPERSDETSHSKRPQSSAPRLKPDHYASLLLSTGCKRKRRVFSERSFETGDEDPKSPPGSHVSIGLLLLMPPQVFVRLTVVTSPTNPRPSQRCVVVVPADRNCEDTEPRGRHLTGEVSGEDYAGKNLRVGYPFPPRVWGRGSGRPDPVTGDGTVRGDGTVTGDGTVGTCTGSEVGSDKLEVRRACGPRTVGGPWRDRGG